MMISAPPPTPDSTGEIAAAGPRVMLLHAGGGTLAMAASAAREVTPRGTAIRLPGAPSIVCGVVNVRGTLVPLVDLGRLLDAAPASAEGWLVTLDLAGRRCAIAVDSLPVLRVADAPPGARPAGSAFLSHEVSVAGTVLPLLDVDALADDLLLH
ncbi:MAG TPA: chemotaxis protein CheW [Gemmatimonadaceae bacterium]|nr:chemotaxis protein CheW [Gemmatimonadaceae bacterium]